MSAKIPGQILRKRILFFDYQTWRKRHNVWGSIESLSAAAQRYQANGSHCEAMAVLTCPKPIPKAILVPRPKHNKAFGGFTGVNNQEERNNIQGNAQIGHRRMKQNIHR
ncbi:hypothetical protein TNCV_2797171 [Trichonephila clavipes]|nr:hypothetical protein TNCV_2797171 [Trichonephila clavipes]